jgi:hypothetical protein
MNQELFDALQLRVCALELAVVSHNKKLRLLTELVLTFAGDKVPAEFLQAIRSAESSSPQVEERIRQNAEKQSVDLRKKLGLD